MSLQQHLLSSLLVVTSLVALPNQAAAEVSEEADFPYTLEAVQTNLVNVHATVRKKTTDGCGFIALMDGKPYLITSQQLILGSERLRFSSSADRIIKPRSIELSTSSDLVRLALAEGDGFALAEHPSMGDRIAVFGSNQSKDSKQSIFGTINGLGADVIEVTAEFEGANNGTPVLNENKEVIGIASYSRESSSHIMKKGTRFDNRTRQFCHRMNGTKWQAVNWKKFNKAFGTPYHASEMMIDDMITVLNSWADGPLDAVEFDEQTNKAMGSWISSHNAIVSDAVDTGKGRREFYSNYADSTKKLSTTCTIQARKLRLLQEQRGLTRFMRDEFSRQASTLEMAADVIDRYGASTY